MKKINALIFSAALMSNAAYAQKISAEKVPSSVTSAFMSKFPNASKTSWKMENPDEYEAEFKMNGKEVSANFDKAGKWLETETEMEVSALPASVNDALKRDFADYKVKEASKIESDKNGNCFEAEIKKGKESYDILFSPEGKMLSKSILKEKQEDND